MAARPSDKSYVLAYEHQGASCRDIGGGASNESIVTGIHVVQTVFHFLGGLFFSLLPHIFSFFISSLDNNQN